MKIRIILITLIALTSTGCVITSSKPAMTPLEIQALQTREYDSTKDVVFPSVISVFQDLGYIVETADSTSGLIKAVSATENSAWLTAFTGATKNTQTATTAFIETIGGIVKVRLNFVTKTRSSSAYGAQDQRDVPILDAQAYQNAFERIENAIFVRSAT